MTKKKMAAAPGHGGWRHGMVGSRPMPVMLSADDHAGLRALAQMHTHEEGRRVSMAQIVRVLIREAIETDRARVAEIPILKLIMAEEETKPSPVPPTDPAPEDPLKKA